MAEQAARAEAAKRYLAHGWSILPLRPRDKRPLIPLGASADPTTFEGGRRRMVPAMAGRQYRSRQRRDFKSDCPRCRSEARKRRGARTIGAHIRSGSRDGGSDNWRRRPSPLFRSPGRPRQESRWLGAGNRFAGRWRLHRRPAVHSPERRFLRMGSGTQPRRDRAGASVALADRANAGAARRTFAFRLAASRERRGGGGSTQLDDCLADRPFALAQCRPRRRARIIARLEPHAMSPPA